MSLSFPATMPVAGPSSGMFEIQRVDYLSAEPRGRIGGVTAGFPLWEADWTLGNLTLVQSDEWRAFVTKLRGPQRLFYSFDYGRRFPRNYPNGFSAFAGFSGAASSWTPTLDGNGTSQVTLTGLPAGLALSTGDYIGFRWGGTKRALVRLLEDATASAGGIITGVSVEPTIPLIVPGSAIAYLDNPVCLMRLLSDTKSGAMDRRGRTVGGRIHAIQELIP
jgi:hypothetical protein